MSHDGGSDMAANAWPGFVDILSAVVIMFVFFVLITAAVLYFYTITYKAKVEGQAAQVIKEVGAANKLLVLEDLQRENQELREQIESVETKSSQGGGSSDTETKNETQAAQSFGAQATEQAMLSSAQDQTLVLFHDPGAITVNEESEAKIIEFIEKMVADHGSDNIELVLTSPKIDNVATQTRAKRLAVARMLNVRNALLASSANRENIKLTVVESEQIEDSTDWTRLQVNTLK